MRAAASVLLVDDDERLRQVLARALAVRGYEVVEASNIPAALTALDGPMALIVTDLDVNGRSGVELVAAMEAGRDRRPVIVMFHADLADAGNLPDGTLDAPHAGGTGHPLDEEVSLRIPGTCTILVVAHAPTTRSGSVHYTCTAVGRPST